MATVAAITYPGNQGKILLLIIDKSKISSACHYETHLDKESLSEQHFSSNRMLIIHCHNIGATYLNANPIFHSRRKHLTLDYYFVKQHVQSGYMYKCSQLFVLLMVLQNILLDNGLCFL